MTYEEAKKFCNNWLDSWTGNRPRELLAFYSEDAFYLDPARPQGLKGRAELLPYFEKLLVKYPSWKWEMEEIFLHEKGFTLKWMAKLTPESAPFFGLDIVEMKNGMISRNEVYFNPAVFKAS